MTHEDIRAHLARWFSVFTVAFTLAGVAVAEDKKAKGEGGAVHDFTLKDSQGNVERYKGETGIALGLDLSFKEKETFGFSVISANTVTAGSHALAGKYGGGKATASLGVGLGAAALVGGNDDNFGLNPLALSTEQGVGAAAGIGFLYIEADK